MVRAESWDRKHQEERLKGQFGQELDGLELCAILESSWRKGEVGP